MKIDPDFMGDRDIPKDGFSTIYMKYILSTRAETYLKGYSTWCKKKEMREAEAEDRGKRERARE